MISEIGLYFLIGLGAGTAGSLIGIGGGCILMPALRFLTGLSPAYAAGTSIFAVLFTGLGGTFKYYTAGNINFKNIAPIIFSAAISSVIFSIYFISLARTPSFIDLLVGIVLFIVSLRMFFEGIPLFRKKMDLNADQNIKLNRKSESIKKITIGTIAGALPALTGLGGGVIFVPAFSFLLKKKLKTAIGSSLACVLVASLISIIFKVSQDFINFYVAIPACAGTFAGSLIGSSLNRKLKSNTLKLIFAFISCYISIKFILSFFAINI